MCYGGEYSCWKHHYIDTLLKNHSECKVKQSKQGVELQEKREKEYILLLRQQRQIEKRCQKNCGDFTGRMKKNDPLNGNEGENEKIYFHCLLLQEIDYILSISSKPLLLIDNLIKLIYNFVIIAIFCHLYHWWFHKRRLDTIKAQLEHLEHVMYTISSPCTTDRPCKSVNINDVSDVTFDKEQKENKNEKDEESPSLGVLGITYAEILDLRRKAFEWDFSEVNVIDNLNEVKYINIVKMLEFIEGEKRRRKQHNVFLKDLLIDRATIENIQINLYTPISAVVKTERSIIEGVPRRSVNRKNATSDSSMKDHFKKEKEDGYYRG